MTDIIQQSEDWNWGLFNKLDKIKCRRLVEVAIMEKLGYKFKDKKWIKKTNVYITPDIMLRKYDKF